MPTESIPEIAYILKGFPRLSETFIANEVYLLEQKGLRLRVYSVKTSSENKVHPVVEKINAPVTYLPGTTSLSQTSFIPWFRENFPKFAAAHKALFQSRPMAYCKTLLQAIRMVFKYRDGALAKPRKVFLKEFMQAGYIALEILQANNVQHLHGHFSHGSTTITLFVSQLTGLPFSFTAHAKDIYQKKLNPGNLLRKKLNAATFVVTCTKSNKEYLEQLCSSKEKVKAIYHGLDTGFFLPGNHASEIETPLILSVGRFVEKKGFSYLIESCRSLKDLGLNFKCVIVGEKDDQFEKIQRMIQSLDLMDTVQLQSEMTQRELLEVYRKATLFALPCQILS
ncbi:MAG: glycosyltransferase, partial [Nitrospinales bacterium]